jgi:hypothetical protein
MTNKKNILDVAPLLCHNFGLESEFEFDVHQYQQTINDSRVALGAFTKYFDSKLHDSWVLETSITGNLFSIRLNDFSTHVFADALIEKKGLNIDHEKLVFPIQLDFKTNSKASFNLVDDDGYLTEIEPTKPDVYLYEQVVSIKNNIIELAFNFWKDSKGRKPGQDILLLISATDIIVSEQKDLAWNKLFGTEFDGYYHYFKDQFDSERYVSDQHICLELIDEYDSLKKTGK